MNKISHIVNSQRIAQALASDYISIYYVDIKDDVPEAKDDFAGTVKEGASGVEVVLAVLHKQESGETVYQYAGSGRPGHCASVYVCRFAELVNALYEYGAHCDQQYDCIQQGNEEWDCFATFHQIKSQNRSSSSTLSRC